MLAGNKKGSTRVPSCAGLGGDLVDSRIRKIVESLQVYAPEKIILFGSHARGSEDESSDIDLVIIKKTKKRFLDRLKEVIEIIRPGFALDVFVYTPSEFRRMLEEGNAFAESISRNGVILYEKTKRRSQKMA